MIVETCIKLFQMLVTQPVAEVCLETSSTNHRDAVITCMMVSGMLSWLIMLAVPLAVIHAGVEGCRERERKRQELEREVPNRASRYQTTENSSADHAFFKRPQGQNLPGQVVQLTDNNSNQSLARLD